MVRFTVGLASEGVLFFKHKCCFGIAVSGLGGVMSWLV